MKLEEISRGFILRSAIRLANGLRRNRDRTLWAIVAEICGVGSTSAQQLCREQGWNPHVTAKAARLTEMEPRQEAWTKGMPAEEGIYDFRSDETPGGVNLIKIYKQGGVFWVEDADIGTNPLACYHAALTHPEYRFREK